MSNLNITAADLVSPAFSWSDVSPLTCDSTDLRNMKANALAAFEPSFTRKDVAGATGQVVRLGEKIGAAEGWSVEQVQDFVFATVRWARENCGVDFGAK